MRIKVSINKSKKKITNKNISKATEGVLKSYKKKISNNNIKITPPKKNLKILENKKTVINKIEKNSKKLETTKKKNNNNNQNNKTRYNRNKQEKETNMKTKQTIIKKKINSWKDEERERKNVSIKKINKEKQNNKEKWLGYKNKTFSRWHKKSIKYNKKVFKWLDLIIHCYMHYQLCFCNTRNINNSKLRGVSRYNYENIHNIINNKLSKYIKVDDDTNLFYNFKHCKFKRTKKKSRRYDFNYLKKIFFYIFNESKCSNEVKENLYKLDLKTDLECIAFTKNSKFNDYKCLNNGNINDLYTLFSVNTKNSSVNYYLVFKDKKKCIYYSTKLKPFLNHSRASLAILYENSNKKFIFKLIYYNEDLYDDIKKLNKNKNLLGFNPLLITNPIQKITNPLQNSNCFILIIMEKYTMNFTKFIDIHSDKLKNEAYFKNLIYILNEIMEQIDIILKSNDTTNIKKYKFLPLDLKPENIVIKTGNTNNILDVKLCDLDGFIIKKNFLNRIEINTTRPFTPPELKTIDFQNFNVKAFFDRPNIYNIFSWYIGTLGYCALFDTSTHVFDNIDNSLLKLKKKDQNSSSSIEKRFIKQIIQCLHKDPKRRRNFYNFNKSSINKLL